MSRLTLCDSVEVTVHRYRLTADMLTLQRTPNGVLVQGPGLVAFCPCEGTPVTVRFSEARVAPPTDLIIKNAVVRAAGVPMFYTPVLWLRSPNRIGLLTPHLGWRAQDGLWMGSGVHVPLQPSVGKGDTYVADLSAGIYRRGGWDLGATLATPGTMTQVRWDRLQTSFVDVDARGSQPFGSTSLNWSADVLRGLRGRTGFVAPERAAVMNDRARVEVVRSNGSVVAGAGVRWETWRATSLDAFGLVGPQIRLAAGTPLDGLGRLETGTSFYAWPSEVDRASMLARHSAELDVDGRPSVFSVHAALHEGFAYSQDSLPSIRGVLAGADTRFSLPLVKSWEGGGAAWSHWIEPFAILGGRVASGNGDESSIGTSRTATAQLGFSNVVGQPGTENAYQFEMRGGIVSSAQIRTTALAIRTRGSGRWVGVGADAVLTSNRAWFSASRVRIGDSGLASVVVRLEGRTDLSWVESRWFTDEAWLPTLRSWLSRGGWTATGETSLSPTEWLAVSGGIGSDMTAGRTLFDFGSVAYRHPCGCLAISATVLQRLGRAGWDAWGHIDLMPH